MKNSFFKFLCCVCSLALTSMTISAVDNYVQNNEPIIIENNNLDSDLLGNKIIQEINLENIENVEKNDLYSGREKNIQNFVQKPEQPTEKIIEKSPKEPKDIEKRSEGNRNPEIVPKSRLFEPKKSSDTTADDPSSDPTIKIDENKNKSENKYENKISQGKESQKNISKKNELSSSTENNTENKPKNKINTDNDSNNSQNSSISNTRENISSIKLPEVSDDEIKKFESLIPIREQKERESSLIKGIISILLVIAGLSMLLIVLTNFHKTRRMKIGSRRVESKGGIGTSNNPESDSVSISDTMLKNFGGDDDSEMLSSKFEDIYKD